MSKINSPSSNNSGTSSETSETQSVEDNNPSGSGTPGTATPPIASSNSRIPKSWTRMKDSNDKDAEAKRPPWRAVSVSTLPKPDKNALLRAKLLDASRRLRAGKSSVAVQTDIVPTKLMKEVNLGTQPDLILYREVGMLTDGSYTKKKEGSDEFILTYSVSQMTDPVSVANVPTQTLLPKLPGDDFMEAYYNSDGHQLKEFSEIERKLLKQVEKIREAKKSQILMQTDGEHEINDNNSSMSERSQMDTDSDTSTTVKTYFGNEPNQAVSTPSLLKPTLSSWNFEYGDIGLDGGVNFQPYTISPNRPWTSFVPLSSALHGSYGGNQRLGWNLLFLAVDDLIQESNRLVDIIEDITSGHSEHDNVTTHQNVQKVQKFEPQQHILPSDYWLPIINQQEKELNEMHKSLKYPNKK